MSDRLPAVDLTRAEALARELRDLLESEFEQLKAATPPDLESLQDRKMVLLDEMTRIDAVQWEPFLELARACRDLHRRNEVLVMRKLDAIRGALQALQVADQGLIEETYDRSGRLHGPTFGNRRPRNAYGA